MNYAGKYKSKNGEVLEIITKNSAINIKCNEPYINNTGILVINDKKLSIGVLTNTFDYKDIGIYMINIISARKVILQSYNIKGEVEKENSFYKYRDYTQEDITPSKYFSNEVSVSNKIRQSMRFTPYMELIYADKNQESIVYNGLSSRNQPNTAVSENLVVVDPYVQRNDKRNTLFDMIVLIDQKDTVRYPLYRKFLFNTDTEIKTYITMERQGILNTTESVPAYTETTVQRYNKWVYYPNTVVFALINLNLTDPKIYIMQTYSNSVNADISPSTLPLLSTSLTLPDGWIYVNIRLDTDTYLVNNSGGLATLVTDNFFNSYQYIPKDQAPFLYENFVSK